MFLFKIQLLWRYLLTMVEFVATILGLGILMFFLIEIVFSMENKEPLGTHFMTIFKLIVISLCLVIGMIILSVLIQILQIQGATSPLYTTIVYLYYIWWTFIGLCLLFLPMYYFVLVPKQIEALTQANEKRKKNEWQN